ncbi:MAG: AHH domain-containing protein [Polyangiaceae bacterium]|nr:AHH domain-containing protein [Polyangiaceae bacterium]
MKKALENSVFKFKRKAGESTHHIVPIESNVEGAERCRKLLDKLKLNIDEEYNGVFLPMYKNSPNPGGAIVHATLDNPVYYKKVLDSLRKATSQADAIRRLRRIRETLLDGTFYHANL